MKNISLIVLFVLIFSCTQNSDNQSTKKDIINVDSLKKHLLDSINIENYKKISQYEAEVEKYKNLANSAYYQVLFQNPELINFRNKLYSNSIQHKKDIIKYILNDYPMILIYQSPMANNQKGFLNAADTSRKNYIDNVRYAWWNGLIDEYKRDMFFVNNLSKSIDSKQDLTFALLIQEFKTIVILFTM